jgi:hypothetical protein
VNRLGAALAAMRSALHRPHRTDYEREDPVTGGPLPRGVEGFVPHGPVELPPQPPAISHLPGPPRLGPDANGHWRLLS